MSADPTRPLPEWSRTQGSSEPPTIMVRRRRRRRRRGPIAALIILIVILVLLVVSDRVANAYAENQMASQVQSSLALSGKPHVTIQGFPFWTQLLAHDFNNVDITASNEVVNSVNAGSGALEIASLNATLHGLHFQGFNSTSATVDQFNATALIKLTALASVGGVPQGVTLTPDGANQVKATISLGPLSDSAVARVTQSGPAQINVKVIDFGGIPASALGNLADFNVNIPKLPSGVSIQSISVTQQGLQVTIAGHDTTLSENS
jgi:hypothetical protein